MACPCTDVGLDEIFNEDFARRDAERYRKRGLPPRARKLLRLIKKQIELKGATSLEAGAGAGGVTVALAREGARAIAIDAMPVAIEYARRLAQEFGVADRVECVVGDFAQHSCSEPVDLVILDRVVCCYPDWEGLLDNAASCSRRVVALSYPADNTFSRIVVWLLNAGQALLRRRFRLHFHSPEAMLARLGQAGFRIDARERYWFWEIVVAARA